MARNAVILNIVNLLFFGVCGLLGMQTWAEDGIQERYGDLAGAKAAMVNGVDSNEFAPQRQPFYSCDMGLLFVAKVADNADPSVPVLKKKIIDMCAVELGAYRNKGPMMQSIPTGAADYFTRMDWMKNYREPVLKLVDEYKGATVFWSYVNPTVEHYDPAKNAFPVGFSGACPSLMEMSGSTGATTFMTLCWEAGHINAQMPPDQMRTFEQNPGAIGGCRSFLQ